MRIFIALDIEDAIRERIQLFIDGVRAFAPDARWVRPASLHVTLKFIGEKQLPEVEEIKKALASVEGAPVELTFRGFGFFPTAKAARVFWIGIESGPELPRLAAVIDKATSQLGVPREEHAFSPHLTLARGGKSGAPQWRKGDRPNSAFSQLQEKLAKMPGREFGTMTAREFYLYESKLSPSGAQYSKIERYALPH